MNISLQNRMMWKVLKKPFFWVYVHAVLLLIAASVPPSDLMRIQRANKFFLIILSDKSVHFIGFGFLAWLLCYGFYKTKATRLLHIKSGVLSVGYGFVIELIQIPLPYRIFSWDDLGADAAGISLALLLFYVFIGRHNKM